MSKVILFSLLNFLSFFSLSQAPFEWPSDLQMDPNDYGLRQLGITEIILFKTYDTSADSTAKNSRYLHYIISYDSLHRVSSFKYDFQNHLTYHRYFSDSLQMDSLKRNAVDNNLPLYFLEVDGQLMAKNYWEVVFTYNDYGVSKMETFNPYMRLGAVGILDGVYPKETNYYEVNIGHHLNEYGEVVQIDGYENDSLIWQKFYTYKTFENNGYRTRLLVQCTLHNITYDFEYLFEEDS